MNQRMTANARSPRRPLLCLENLEKHFAGTHALKGITLEFLAGEIHAIVGENGAGKSTLIKILTGAYQKTSGRMTWDGHAVSISCPEEALMLGIAAVHQEMVLCLHLTVAANMFLGSESSRAGILRERNMNRQAQAVLDALGFQLRADAVVSDLTIGQQQLVAVARAAMRRSRLVIFDEPTAYLTRKETSELFELIRRLQQRNITVIYISHHLEEIFELADRVSVLRDGRLISTKEVKEAQRDQVVRDMVNRPIEHVHYKEQIPIQEELLRVSHLSGRGFQDISLTVRRGEVVGLYGLIGAGRSEFLHTLFGRIRRVEGCAYLKNELLAPADESEAIARGVALIPENRRDQGLCLNLPITLNLNLPAFGRISRFGIVDRRAERMNSEAQIDRLEIRPHSRSTETSTLSGGSQQKVVLGKWLIHGAELYLADEPTAGVDIRTKHDIYKLFADLLRQGAGLILVSSYLPEVFDLADTLHVLSKGRLVASYKHGATSQEQILADAMKA